MNITPRDNSCPQYHATDLEDPEDPEDPELWTHHHQDTGELNEGPIHSVHPPQTWKEFFITTFYLGGIIILSIIMLVLINYPFFQST